MTRRWHGSCRQRFAFRPARVLRAAASARRCSLPPSRERRRSRCPPIPAPVDRGPTAEPSDQCLARIAARCHDCTWRSMFLAPANKLNRMGPVILEPRGRKVAGASPSATTARQGCGESYCLTTTTGQQQGPSGIRVGPAEDSSLAELPSHSASRRGCRRTLRLLRWRPAGNPEGPIIDFPFRPAVTLCPSDAAAAQNP